MYTRSRLFALFLTLVTMIVAFFPAFIYSHFYFSFVQNVSRQSRGVEVLMREFQLSVQEALVNTRSSDYLSQADVDESGWR